MKKKSLSNVAHTSIQVGIIMGSKSDYPTMQAAEEILEEFGVSYETKIVSAHRTPELMCTYAQSAVTRGLKIIIAGAGGAAHLPGMVAAQTILPVIGVPIVSGEMRGLDSLYSIVQMPRGVPVATVAIGNATNAGLLAVQILSTIEESGNSLQKKLEQYRTKMRDTVLKQKPSK